MKDHEFEEHMGHHGFHYSVDDEPYTTREHVLTPSQILSLAGLNPANHERFGVPLDDGIDSLRQAAIRNDANGIVRVG